MAGWAAEDFAQRAVGLDQDVDGDLAVQAHFHAYAFDGFGGVEGVVGGVDLGDGDVGQPGAGDADEDVEVADEGGVVDVVDADADAAVAVGVAGGQASGHFGVFGFAADGGAVFAVQGDVEDGAGLGLAFQAFLHQFFGAGVVVADGEDCGGLG